MESCVLFVNGQPLLVVSVAGIEIARLELSSSSIDFNSIRNSNLCIKVRHLLKRGLKLFLFSPFLHNKKTPLKSRHHVQ